MKISPIATGTGVPSASDNSLGKTAPDKIARAKAIASGQEPVEQQPSGDMQVDRTQSAMKKIKMRTQVSQNRHEFEAPVVEAAPELIDEIQSPISDTVEQASATEETRPLSPQFAALAKAKRAVQIERAEVAKMKAEFEAQKGSANPESISMADLKANPLSVLQEAGVTYDQLTEAILNNQSSHSPEIQELRNELKSLKEELNGQLSSRDQQAEQQVLTEIKREIVNLVEQQPEQYEAIRHANAQDTVKELIHRTWKQTGEVIDVTTAAELVETQLIEEALPFAKIKKLQSMLNPAPEAPAQTPVLQKPGTKIMRTLTNRDSALPNMDRRARAIAAMQGTLKKG